MLKTAHSPHETKTDSALFSTCVSDHAVLGSTASRLGGRIDSLHVDVKSVGKMPSGVSAPLDHLPASVTSTTQWP